MSTEYWINKLHYILIQETSFIPLISNIRLLRDKEKYWKAQIKRYKNQIKGGKNAISTLNSEYEKKLSDLRKKYISKDKKTKNKYICHHCGFIHMNKASYEEYCFKKSCTCKNHHYFTRFNLKSHIDKEYTRKIQNAEYCVKTDILILENTIKIYDIIKKRIVQLSQVCPYCKKNCDTLLSTNCSNGHKVCQNCFDKVEDSCLICSDIINFNLCDICYSKVPKLVSTKCGNNHKCCQSCLTKISSIGNSCPFCRCEMQLL